MTVEGTELRPVPDFPGYFVSRDGEVWSQWILSEAPHCAQKVRAKDAVLGDKVSKLKAVRSRSGYLLVALIKDGRWQRISVHRLVMSAFCGPCPPGMEVCHNNGVRDDNRLENLRYDTHKGNMLDRYRHGTARTAKLTPIDALAIRQLAWIGVPSEDIASMFRVNVVTVDSIAANRSWRWLLTTESVRKHLLGKFNDTHKPTTTTASA